LRLQDTEFQYLDQYHSCFISSFNSLSNFTQRVKIYEIDKKQKGGPGFVQLVHDGKFFVGSPNEPEFGQEFYIFSINLKP